jgi:predicted NBD/HSP70 family sugar kinase
VTLSVSTSNAGPPGNDAANNSRRLLTALHLRGGAATRAELTADLDCGRSAVSYALTDLARRGLVGVDERPSVPTSSRGRPSHHVRIGPTSPVAIAVHLRVDTLDVCAVELGGRLLRTEREPVEPSPDVESIFQRIGRLVRLVARETARPCAGIGISMPSPIRAADGYALAPRHLNWTGVPVREFVEAQLGAVSGRAGPDYGPVYVGNDANLAAIAEHRHGAGAGSANLLYVTTEHIGIGGALVSGGRLFTGASGYAMEVGHTTANPGGQPCRCGARGCLETEADSRALLRAAGRPDLPATGLEYRARVLLSDAAAGDPAALEAVHTVAARLGTGLAVLVNLLDPDRIVLGGLLARLLPLAAEPLGTALRSGSFLERAVPVPVVAARLAAPALLGAAELVFAPLLSVAGAATASPTGP